MKKFLILIFAALFFNLLPGGNFAFAINTQPLSDYQFNVKNILPEGATEQTGDLKSETPAQSLILRVIDFATTIIGSIAILLLIIAGFMYMTALGDQTRLDRAKEIFQFTAIGLLVTFLAYIIVIFVQSIFISN